jgi:GTP cyclohydrolase I
MDHKKIMLGVKLIIEGIGEDVLREGLIGTPERVIKMYEEVCSGYKKDAGRCLSKVFKVDNNEMIVEKDIDFHSLCEHHMMPFFGKVHIGYIPDGKVAGISKLARTVEVYARRLQLQERLTNQVADAIMDYLGAKGSIVMIEGEHLCMSMRGVKKVGSSTVTLVRRGDFKEDKELTNAFMQVVGK